MTIKYIEKMQFAILLLLMASLPFYMMISNALLVIGISLSIIKILLAKRFNWKEFDLISSILFCYFILELIGLLYTDKENIKVGLFSLEKHLPFIFIPLLFFNFNLSKRNKEMLLTVFIIANLLASLICVVWGIYSSISVYGQIFNDWMFSHDRFSDPIGLQPVYFAMYLSFSFLIVLKLLRDNFILLSKLKKIVFLFLMSYFFIIIILLGSRVIIVALMLIIMAQIFLYARSQKSYWAYGMILFVPIIFSVTILLQPTIKIRFLDMLKSNYSETNYGSYYARWLIWKPGMEVIGENLWLGVGTGDQQVELDRKFIKHNFLDGVQFFNMHNQYLQTWLANGIFGLIIFLLFFVVQLIRSIRLGDILYASFLILFMLGCLTESMLSRNKGVVFLILFSFIFFKTDVNLFTRAGSGK